ncbi:MAG TPA: FAD-binding protein [Candidatus Binatia bacterium]|nr:FAD-binding protein [Candidatus Binatia bacterium]
MKGLPAETDFIVIGAGVAGLRAAIDLAAAGRVLLLTKTEAPPRLAEVPLSDEEEVILHLQDTLVAGDGLASPEAAKIVIEEGAERIEELISWAGRSSSFAKMSFESEPSYRHSHVLRAPGNSAAAEVLRQLWSKAQTLKTLSVGEFQFAAELLRDDERVNGVSVITDKGLPEEINCSAVLLATGGLGRVFGNTTNPDGATGDGIALAFRAGAELSDLEFVQFCPTALYVKNAPRFPLSPALRREGAFLRNIELDRFMRKYHPEAENAPADVVSRAIVHEMEISRAKDPFVYLDLTHLNSASVQKRFPRIYQTCMKHNLDITEDLIPVRPAAHFAMGGVRADMNGKTSLAGLYAAGEVACTGVHGANRFPSNALLEGLVCGARAGKAMQNELKIAPRTAIREKKAASQNGPVDAGLEELIGQMQAAMWKNVGVVRMRPGMQETVKLLEGLAPRVGHPRTRRSFEAANLHATALLVTRSALARQESRGAHYRIDYPGRDDKKFLKHSVIKGDSVRFI